MVNFIIVLNQVSIIGMIVSFEMTLSDQDLKHVSCLRYKEFFVFGVPGCSLKIQCTSFMDLQDF